MLVNLKLYFGDSGFKKVTIFSFLVFHFVIASIEIPSKTYSHVDSCRIPLDHKLMKLMNFENGVFVEVGANDGLKQSNTKLFEEFYGWTGVLVEPAEVLFEQLCANRPYSNCFKCALGSFEEDQTYAYGNFTGGLTGGFLNKRNLKNKVLIRSLQSILDECNIKHIHFFSLDVEGYELNILKGVDFDKTTFDYLLIETRPFNHDKIVSFLFDRGYDIVECFTNYNQIDNPRWDGTHNDYLFKRKIFCNS